MVDGLLNLIYQSVGMFQPIGQLLPSRLAANKISRPVVAASIGEEVMSAVAQLCGEVCRKHARFLYLKENVAAVATLRPAIAHEIYLRGQEICARVNQRLAREALKRVRVVQ